MGLLDKLLGRSKDVADKVGLDDAAKKVVDVAGDVAEKVGDAAGGVVDKAGDVADKVGLDTAAEKVGDVASGAVDKAKDVNGRDCFVMVLSTREQHIRKEKATSNVCSNQAFLATLAGASLLAKGEKGMKEE